MDFPMNFIRATQEHNTVKKPVPAPYLRKAFVSDAETTAQFLIGACGFYELYVNGVRYTKGAMAPYINNPDDMVYFDTYEIPLVKGENVIGILLGNGFQNNVGGYNWKFTEGPFVGAPQFALSVTWQDAQGQEQLLEADTTFKTAPSPIVFDDYRFGEHYDARLEIPGWNLPGFDDSAWQNALPVPKPRGEKRICQAEPIVPVYELKPVSITPAEGGFRYDFGANCAGVCRLKIQGKPGQEIRLRHGEWVTEDNTLDIKNLTYLRTPEETEQNLRLAHQDYYICKGEGTEIHTPLFTYHGFQYVQVTGITQEQATEDLLTYVVMNSDLKERGSFSCSNETVNKLQEITRRADLANFYYFPTDCPQREKNGWTADAALSLEQMLWNFSIENSMQEWQRNVCKAQDARGALPGIVPTTGWGFHWGNGPAWDCVLVYTPYFVYQYRGETEIFKESQASVLRYLNYLTTRADDRGLLAIGLGDWCHAGRAGSKYGAPLEFTDTVIAMDIAQKAAVLFEAVNMIPQRDFANTLASQFRENVRKHLIDFDTMTAIGNCQTTQAMGIFYNIFTQEEKPAALQVLLKMIHEKDDRFDVGVLGGRVIFHVLAQNGYADLALRMIVGPEFPSYGHWLECGATTLWEAFRDRNTSPSRNHHFWGDISSWFFQYLAGIRINPTGKNINHVDVAPCFVSGLNSAQAYHLHPAGRISSSWKLEDGKYVLTVEVPAKLRGEIRLENGFTFQDGDKRKALDNGTYIIVH